MREESRGGWIDRALQVFGDVRAGEGATVLLMCCNVALLLVAYYVLKTVREPLILLAGGAELKSYAAAAQAATLVAYVPLYGWLAERLPRQRFLTAIILFFAGCVELFVIGGRLRLSHIGFVFYVWVGIFSLTTIAQFWSFANELYSRPEGNRLFPLIAVGSTAGAPLGAALAEYLFGSGVGPFTLMQIAVVLLLAHLVLYTVVWRRMKEAGPSPGEEPIKAGNGFALVLKSRYLTLAALLLVLLNQVNTIGEFVLGQTLLKVAESKAHTAGFNAEAFIGQFYGSYFLWVNLLTIVLQAFVASRLVKHLGWGGVLLALPVVAVGVYGVAAVGAGLVALRWLKTAENSTDYSLMNTAKQMLWLPTSPEEKYKAKQAIDTLFVRAGDVLAAGIVFVGVHRLGFGVRAFSVANVAIALLAIGVGVVLLREYGRVCQPVRGVGPGQRRAPADLSKAATRPASA
jgi:AAA family ATP:ADP antiporter